MNQPHPSDSSPTAPSRRRVIWTRILLAFIGFMALFYAGVYVAGVVATNRWDDYVAAKRAAGEPLTFVEIAATLPEVSNVGTAAARLEALRDALESADDELISASLFYVEFDLTVDQRLIPENRVLLATHAELLAGLADIQTLPSGRISIPLDGPPALVVKPELQFLRAAAHLIRRDATMRLIDGDFDGAARSTEQLLAIARTLRPAPMMLVAVMDKSIVLYSLENLQSTLDAGELDNAALQRVAARVREAESEQTVQLALRGERAMAVETISAFATGRAHPDAELDSDSLSSRKMVDYYGAMPIVFLRGNCLKAGESLDRLVAAADDPAALIKTAYQIDAELNASQFHKLAWNLIPQQGPASVVHARTIAILRSAEAALAAERFRLATGRFPGSLGELVPTYLQAVPIDPFTGTPLLLVAKDDGIVIYSVNDNGVDDGGRLIGADGQQQRPDIGFRLLAPDGRKLVLFDPAPKPKAQPDEPPMPPRAPLIVVPDNVPEMVDEQR